MDEVLVGNVYKCVANGDYYIICNKEKEDSYKTYWLQIGYAEDCESDIIKDIFVNRLNPSLIKKIVLFNYLNLIKKSHEISSSTIY